MVKFGASIKMLVTNLRLVHLCLFIEFSWRILTSLPPHFQSNHGGESTPNHLPPSPRCCGDFHSVVRGVLQEHRSLLYRGRGSVPVCSPRELHHQTQPTWRQGDVRTRRRKQQPLLQGQLWLGLQQPGSGK